MKSEPERCPRCGGPAEVYVDEVDVGVGVASGPPAYDCPQCGRLWLRPCCWSWNDELHKAGCTGREFNAFNDASPGGPGQMDSTFETGGFTS